MFVLMSVSGNIRKKKIHKLREFFYFLFFKWALHFLSAKRKSYSNPYIYVELVSLCINQTNFVMIYDGDQLTIKVGRDVDHPRHISILYFSCSNRGLKSNFSSGG